MDSFLNLDLTSSTSSTPTRTGTADDIMSSIFGGPVKEKKPIDAIESIFGSTDVSPLIKSTPTPQPILNEENIIEEQTTTTTTTETTTTTLVNSNNNSSSIDEIKVVEAETIVTETVGIIETETVTSVVDNSPPLPIETETTVDEPIFIQNAPILVVNPLEVKEVKKIESDDEKDNSTTEKDIDIENEIFTPINAAIESSSTSPSTKDETTTTTAATKSTSEESPSNSFSMSVSSIAEELSNSNIISSTVTGTIEQQVYEKPDEPQISPLLSEFNKIFHSTIPLENSPLEILKISAFTGALKYSPLRGLAWKLFLGGLDINRLDKWETDITKQRKRYEKLKEEHCFDPRNSNSTYDPLSQNDDSPWNKFFKNLDVQKIIKIDLERTHPDNEFFSNPVIREMMLHILFVYSRTNGVISYRQGMHELLAPIISLYHQEYTEYKKLDGDEISIVDFIYDKEYLEHDTFAIFEHLMKFTADWYAPALPNLTPAAPVPPTATTSLSTSSSSSPTSPLSLSSNSTTAVIAPSSSSNSLPSSPNTSHKNTTNTSSSSSSVEDSESSSSSSTRHNDVVQKCKFIHSVLLKQKDNELYLHLNSLDIEPQIYLLRWVRLLFGREFHFDDVLNIWDALFAYGDNLAMIDYFCISMLTYIREHLLKSDSIYALKRIYKYPPVEDVYMLIKKSLELKDSNCSIAVMVKTAQPPLTSSCNSSGKQFNNNNNSNNLNSSSNINVTSNFPSSINNSVFPEIYIGESSSSSSTTTTTSSFQPYSSQFSSSSTTPIDPLSNKTTPIIISSHHTTTAVTVSSTATTTTSTLNNSSGSNTPLSLSSNSTTASSTPNLLNTPNLSTHHSSPNVLSGQQTSQPSHSNIASTFFNNNNSNNNNNSHYQAATVSVRTNHKDIFGSAKEADLFSLFSTATTSNSSGSGMSLSSSNPTISIGQARSNYNKHKSMNLSASPFFSSPSSTSSAEIEKLKNNQTKLANTLNEILPFLEKGKSYLTGGEEELSKSDIDNFILAIDKVKQVQEALSNNNNTTINE